MPALSGVRVCAECRAVIVADHHRRAPATSLGRARVRFGAIYYVDS